MKFFSDRNLAQRLIRMIDAYDAAHRVCHQDDDGRFSRTTSDIELIRTISSETPKPVFLTADFAMAKRVPDERKVLAASELTVFFFRKRFHHLDFHTQALNFLRIWPQIVLEAQRCREPTAFEITPSGKKAERLCATSELLK